MRISLGHTRVNVGVLFAGVLAAMLALDKSGACAQGLIACVLHEAGHLACLAALRDYPGSVTLSFFGMRIERKASADAFDELLVAASGPAMNYLLCLLFLPFNRMFAAVNLLAGLFNSLPCLPLDGGRVIYFALLRSGGEKAAKKLTAACSFAALALCIMGGAALLFVCRNFTLLAVSIYLVFAFLQERRDML